MPPFHARRNKLTTLQRFPKEPEPMDLLLLAVLLAVGLFVLKNRDDRRHILLLASYLRPYQIEQLMERLIQGYLRALDERDPTRRDQVWQGLETSERQLAEQLGRLVAQLAQAPAADTRVSHLALPLADRWWPQNAFDLREAMAIHARGVAELADSAARRSPKDKAYTLMAELLLLQHTCHWYCKSKTVASARLLARHKTAYDQVLRAVSPGTRQAYLSLTGQRLGE